MRISDWSSDVCSSDLRQVTALMHAGVSFADPARFDLRGQLRHGRDVVIDVGCVFEGDVALADDVQIGPYCVLRNVKLGDGPIVTAHSVLVGFDAGADFVIGTFALVHPTTAGRATGRERGWLYVY